MPILDAIVFLIPSILPALGRYSVNIRISEGVNSGQIYRALNLYVGLMGLGKAAWCEIVKAPNCEY